MLNPNSYVKITSSCSQALKITRKGKGKRYSITEFWFMILNGKDINQEFFERTTFLFLM